MKFRQYKDNTEPQNITNNQDDLSDISDTENFEEYDDVDSYNDEDDLGYYDEETDTYYTREQLEREQRYLDRVQARDDFKNKVKNPFGIGDKINDFDDKIKYGSSKTKLIFILGTLAILTILVVIFTMIF